MSSPPKTDWEIKIVNMGCTLIQGNIEELHTMEDNTIQYHSLNRDGSLILQITKTVKEKPCQARQKP